MRIIVRAILRAGWGFTAAIAVFALGVGVAVWHAFDGIGPLEDGRVVGPATTVVDGYTASFILDAGGGSIVLIDAGQDETAKPILDALARAGHDESDVVAILLTHGHSDHRAGVGRFPNARVYAHEDELPLLRGEVRARGLVPWFSGRAEPLEPTDIVRDGDTMTIGTLSIRVFHVPGHTAGSVAWLVNDTLFMGDAAGSTEDGELEPSPWVFTDDRDMDEASLMALPDRLERAGAHPTLLVFSHSAPLEPSALTAWIDRQSSGDR